MRLKEEGGGISEISRQLAIQEVIINKLLRNTSLSGAMMGSLIGELCSFLALKFADPPVLSSSYSVLLRWWEDWDGGKPAPLEKSWGAKADAHNVLNVEFQA